MKITYISPKAEAFKLLSAQNLLQGSPDSSLADMEPNGMINESF